MSAPEPRIAPGTRQEIGALNGLIATAISRASGSSRPLNVFTTLARHRKLFRSWLRFAGRLMPGGKLPRADTELLILRTAHNCGCDYEWAQHERLGRRAGLSAEQIEAARQTDHTALTDRQRVLLAGADELHDHRALSEQRWGELRPLLSDAQLIELCMLVGHYEMLAMTLNSLQVQPER